MRRQVETVFLFYFSWISEQAVLKMNEFAAGLFRGRRRVLQFVSNSALFALINILLFYVLLLHRLFAPGKITQKVRLRPPLSTNCCGTKYAMPRKRIFSALFLDPLFPSPLPFSGKRVRDVGGRGGGRKEKKRKASTARPPSRKV
jgi:hypothetical protein